MESRITELEINLALQNDLLETLNRIVADQQQQIGQMKQEIFNLNQYLQVMEPSSRMLPMQEIPPHY